MRNRAATARPARPERNPVIARALRFRGRRARRLLWASGGIFVASLAASLLLKWLEAAASVHIAWPVLAATLTCQWLVLIPTSAVLVAMQLNRDRVSGRLDELVLSGIPKARLFRSLTFAAALPGYLLAAALVPVGFTAGLLAGEAIGYCLLLALAAGQSGVTAHSAALIALAGWRRAFYALRGLWAWVLFGLVTALPLSVPVLFVMAQTPSVFVAALCLLLLAAPATVVAWQLTADALEELGERWPLPAADEQWWQGLSGQTRVTYRLSGLETRLQRLARDKSCEVGTRDKVRLEVERILVVSLGRSLAERIMRRAPWDVADLAAAIQRGDAAAAEEGIARLCHRAKGAMHALG